MNKVIFKRIFYSFLSVVLVTGCLFTSKLQVKAANQIVTGTVAKGTTASMLYLYEPSNGTYKITIDSNTDTSACKFLTVGKTVTVSMYRGDDSNLHAAAIASGKNVSSVSVDSSNRSTVKGTVMDATTEEMLYLNTSDGEMHIKIDSGTNTSGCRILVSGANVTVVCSRGSDAYMHALSITTTDTSSSSSSSSSSTSSSSSSTPTGTAVTGTPTSNSRNGVLYLSTNDGTYYLICDSSCDTSSGFMFTPGNKLTAYIYRGDDANMHASKVIGTKASTSTLRSGTSTFTGTVESNSSEEMMYLNTSGGVMKFKIDSNTSLTGAKNLIKGSKVSVTGSVGADTFWHAITISSTEGGSTDVGSSSSSGSSSASGTAVTGYPTSDSKDGVLYLSTKDGTYYLICDSSCDTSGGFMFTPSNKLTAYIYRGSDANMHASKVVGTKASTSTLRSGSSTFTGTVEGSSTEEMLYLNTSGGTMKFKIDSNTSLSGAKNLVKGKSVSVTGSVGADTYWHAITITQK